MEIGKIFFDMDGVLANFVGGAKKLCNHDVIDQAIATKEENDLLWDKIREVDHYYDKLEPMPGAIQLFNIVYEKYGDKCEVLTGIPEKEFRIPYAAEDKINWMHRVFNPNVVVHTVYRKEKIAYCTGKDCILIDDYIKNTKEWENAGGTSIYSKDCESTIRLLKERGIL